MVWSPQLLGGDGAREGRGCLCTEEWAQHAVFPEENPRSLVVREAFDRRLLAGSTAAFGEQHRDVLPAASHARDQSGD